MKKTDDATQKKKTLEKELMELSVYDPLYVLVYS